MFTTSQMKYEITFVSGQLVTGITVDPTHHVGMVTECSWITWALACLSPTFLDQLSDTWRIFNLVAVSLSIIVHR